MELYIFIGWILSCLCSQLIVDAAKETLDERGMDRSSVSYLCVIGNLFVIVCYPIFIAYIIYLGITHATAN